MPDYFYNRVPGGTFFFTANLLDRRSNLFVTNIAALRERMPESEALPRYETIARLLTGDANAKPEAGADWIAQLVSDLNAPPLRTYGLTPFLIGVMNDQVFHDESKVGWSIAVFMAVFGVIGTGILLIARPLLSRAVREDAALAAGE